MSAPGPSAEGLVLAISTYRRLTDTRARMRSLPWPRLAERLSTHDERDEKDGPLWSPAAYPVGATRRNESVLALSALVGDLDGVELAEVAPALAAYEYVVYSTYSHVPDDPHYRIVLPLARPIPATDWAATWHAANTVLFDGRNDPATKDASRAYYWPACLPGAERFHVHHRGRLVDPDELPAVALPTAAGNGASPTATCLPLGRAAVEFVALGAPVGEQRGRALAAARNYLSAGYTVEQTGAALWRGLQASPWAPEREPWTEQDAWDIARDLARKPAPPVEPLRRSAARNGRQPAGDGRQPGPVLVALSDVPPEAVRWLWPARVPRGKLTVLDGDPGLGKSVLTLDLAARVTTGAAMPDGTRSDLDGPAGVVLLSAEDGLADTIRPRLDAAGADVSRIVALTAVVRYAADDGDSDRTAEDLPTLADLAALREAIRRVDAALVVVDPIMAYLPDGTSAYRDKDVRRALAPLAALAEETGAAVLVVRHLNKQPGGNPVYRGGGSIGIIGAARSGLLVAEDPDDPDGGRRILAPTKCNLAEPPAALAYHLEPTPDGSVKIVWEGATTHTAATLLAVPAGDDARSELAGAVDYLRDALTDGEQTAEDVQSGARKCGISDMTLRRAKTTLRVEVRREGFGRGGSWFWRLPAEPSSLDVQEQHRCSQQNGEHLCDPGTSKVDSTPASREAIEL